MLVLSRNARESIQIGSNIIIEVVSISHGRVVLGITAPREVPVVRSEILQRGQWIERVRDVEQH